MPPLYRRVLCCIVMHMKDEARIKLIVAALRRYMERNRITQVKFAEATGVDQSQLSRILSGRSTRISKSMRILMEYAGVNSEVASAQHRQIEWHPRLLIAVTAAWDGTDRGGNLLAKLIDAAAEFQREHVQ